MNYGTFVTHSGLYIKRGCFSPTQHPFMPIYCNTCSLFKNDVAFIEIPSEVFKEKNSLKNGDCKIKPYCKKYNDDNNIQIKEQ